MRIVFITSKLNFKTAGGSIDEMDLMMRKFQSYGSTVTAVTAFSRVNSIDRTLPYRVAEEQILGARLLSILFGALRLFRKYEHEADVFFADGHLMLYGAGLYRLLGGKTPVLLFFNRELSAWPENVSALLDTARKSLIRRLKERTRFLIEKYLLIPLVSHADFYTFTSPFLEKAYQDFNLRTVGKSFVFSDPYDIESVFAEQHLTEDDYVRSRANSERITLFYSSRMAAGKGFDLLVQAFSKVKNKERYNLILGGTGPEEALVKKMVHDLGLDPYVEFPGWVTRDELRKNLRKADIFIQARWRQDMTSLSLTEAMAFGLPSIVPSGGGLEWVAGRGALTFKPDDTEDLAAKIERLGNDGSLRNELSRQCFVRFKEANFDYRQTLPKLHSILTNLAAKAR